MMRVADTDVELIRGDITAQAVDAIVNAANSSLLGGGGVDGAIHRKGGPAILADCRAIIARQGGCAAGDAVITGAGNLPAKWVVHTVGPVWRGGGQREEATLERAWRRSLEVAVAAGARSIAFPAISTGAYGFPKDLAARVSIRTVGRFVRAERGKLDLVRIVLFSQSDLDDWNQEIGALLS